MPAAANRATVGASRAAQRHRSRTGQQARHAVTGVATKRRSRPPSVHVGRCAQVLGGNQRTTAGRSGPLPTGGQVPRLAR